MSSANTKDPFYRPSCIEIPLRNQEDVDCLRGILNRAEEYPPLTLQQGSDLDMRIRARVNRMVRDTRAALERISQPTRNTQKESTMSTTSSAYPGLRVRVEALMPTPYAPARLSIDLWTLREARQLLEILRAAETQLMMDANSLQLLSIAEDLRKRVDQIIDLTTDAPHGA